MVRLLLECMRLRCFQCVWFQSHNGAIAALLRAAKPQLEIWFQSHNGAIAALLRAAKPQLEIWFQSHNGAIAA